VEDMGAQNMDFNLAKIYILERGAYANDTGLRVGIAHYNIHIGEQFRSEKVEKYVGLSNFGGQ
jgi:hypothetical protein